MSAEARRPVFAILRALVEAHAGLHYEPQDQEIFLDRVSVRAADAGFESLLDYYYFLKYDPGGAAELEHLIDALLVHETFFFRELDQLQTIVRGLVSPVVLAGGRPRIWSSACATGEEPLSLAMLLDDAGLLSSVDLIASDISLRALERAQAGQFNRRAIREGIDAALVRRWIHDENGVVTVPPHLRRAITWKQVNLCDGATVAAMGPCDIILCRNVLIYFDDATVARVIADFDRALRPNGALFVGVSESLFRFSTVLACEEVGGVFFYRKLP